MICFSFIVNNMIYIQADVSLLKYNTFHIDAKAKYFVVVKSEEDVLELLKTDIFQTNKRLLLGWWSNVLLTSDFDWLVIKNEIMWKEILEDSIVLVKSGAGEQRNPFVFRCVNQWLGWIENLISIPGTVWASPIQNIWAYGVEVKDTIFEVEGIDLKTWEKKKYTNTDCKFTYRDSIFKQGLQNDFLVTYVTYKLKKIDADYKFNLNYKDIIQKMTDLGITEKDLTLQQFVDIIVSLRAWKLPNHHEIWTAWSFFKNPIVSRQQFDDLKLRYPDIVWFENGDTVKLSAWRLIEKSGFKWITRWNVWVYHWHALILVNNGWWTGKEVVDLENEIKNKVLADFGVELHSEVIHA